MPQCQVSHTRYGSHVLFDPFPYCLLFVCDICYIVALSSSFLSATFISSIHVFDANSIIVCCSVTIKNVKMAFQSNLPPSCLVTRVRRKSFPSSCLTSIWTCSAAWATKYFCSVPYVQCVSANGLLG